MRQWVVWAVAGFLVAAAFAFASPLGDGPVPVAWVFLLLLLCFMTGSLANSMFLSRSFRRGGHIVLPAVREPEAIERAPEDSGQRRQSPVQAVTTRARPERTRTEVPAFASSSEIGGSIGVTVLVSSDVAAEPESADLNELHVIDSIPAQQARRPETVAANEESGPYPGAVQARPDGRSPDSSYRVKGNTRSKRYHTMQSPYYERTKAGVWFRSAADAERAGFSAWNSRVNDAV
ncbi:sunset domain-containing protein [Saccharopolyspora mangrovi]|uniref:sunset domain-containing protein n=1 Tax=Saccharopolyspora mangrovi TaxID=3082379 RepID=UPI002B4BD1FA|nr:hypothetical protein [Saccharopolyspora sp. S2-29]